MNSKSISMVYLVILFFISIITLIPLTYAATPPLTSQIITNSPAQIGAGFGFQLVSGDINGDGVDDIVVGADNATVTVVREGMVKIFFGNAGAPGTLDTTADALLTRDPPEFDADFGRRVAIGDVNGDGYGDVLVAVAFADTGAVNSGEVRIFFGGPGPFDTTSDATLIKTPAEVGAYFGRDLTSGDVNGDGYDDVIVGVPYAATGGQISSGEVRIFYGGPGAFDTTVDVTITKNPPEIGAVFGYSIATGDLNNDGYDDLIASAFGADSGTIRENGEVQIFYGISNGIGTTPNAILTKTPAETGARFGRWVSSGDVNGDGYDDVVSGAPFSDTGAIDNGEVRVFFGGPSTIDTTADAIMSRTPAQDEAVFGRRVIASCDLNNDGFADFATSGFLTDSGILSDGRVGLNNGEVNVFLGKSGAFDITPDAVLIQDPAEVGGKFGVGMACGDVNADGYDELMISSSYDNGAKDNGQVKIFYGGTGAFYGDIDSDGIDNLTDNCPAVANPLQEDNDHDGIGNVCDPTPNGVGTIILVQNTIPDNQQNFGFTTTGGLTPPNFYLDDDSDPALPNNIVFTNVPSGTYTATQGSVFAYPLSSIVCVDPDNGSTVNVSTRVATIDLDPGESITCTYTNTQRGTITVIKDTIPNGPQNFVYTTTGGLPVNFALDDDSDATLPNTRVFANLLSGTYTITETAVTGFSLTNLVCTDPDNGSTVNISTRVATIDLDPGESITCTYTNTAN